MAENNQEESKLAQKLESEVKFTEEEMKKLSDLQNGYQRKQLQFGQLRVQRLQMEQQFAALDQAEEQIEKEYTEIQQSEVDLVNELNEKYGPGTLDPTTGTFTPETVTT